MLRQRSRPYLFSNTLAPAIAATSLKVLAMLRDGDGLRRAAARERRAVPRRHAGLGFELLPGEHPIIPVMLYEAPLAQAFAAAPAGGRGLRHRLLLPGGAQGPGAHPHPDVRRPHAADIDAAIQAFAKVGRALGVIE